MSLRLDLAQILACWCLWLGILGCGTKPRNNTSFVASCDNSLPLASVPKLEVSHAVQFTKDWNDELSYRKAFGPISAVEDKVFFVWGDLGDRIHVTQSIAGKETTVPLDPNPDYTVLHDAHHTFSLAIDKKGYIHVAGDMHGYPGNPPTVARYRDQTSMNWVSNKPYDITGGFTFVGTKGAATAIPAKGITYPMFHEAPNGDLFLTAIVDAYKYGKAPATPRGNRALGLYKYDADKKAWSAVGDYPAVDLASNGEKFKVFFWEIAGTDGWFQGFIPSIEWDTQNRMHIAWAAVVDSSYKKNSRLFYARSSDGGTSWERLDGSPLAPPPFRGAAGAPNVADVVIDTQGKWGLADHTHITVDSAGLPFIYNRDSWYRFDGKTWTANPSIEKVSYGYSGFQGADGIMHVLHGSTQRIWRMASSNEDASVPVDLASYFKKAGLSFDGFYGVNKRSFKTTGAMWGIGINEKTKKQSVIKVYLSKDPVVTKIDLPPNKNHTTTTEPSPDGNPAPADGSSSNGSSASTTDAGQSSDKSGEASPDLVAKCAVPQL